MSIARLGAVARPTPKAPEATDPTLGLLAAFGENPQAAREYVNEVRAAIADNERVKGEADAKIAEAQQLVDRANAAEQQAQDTREEVLQDCAQRQVLTNAARAQLDADSIAHDAKVRDATDALVTREIAVSAREQAATDAEAKLAMSRDALDALRDALATREASIAEREAAQDAREARLKAALG